MYGFILDEGQEVKDANGTRTDGSLSWMKRGGKENPSSNYPFLQTQRDYYW